MVMDNDARALMQQLVDFMRPHVYAGGTVFQNGAFVDSQEPEWVKLRAVTALRDAAAAAIASTAAPPAAASTSGGSSA